MKIMNTQLSNQTNNLGLETPRASFDEIKWNVSFSAENFAHVATWTVEELARITRYQSNVVLPTEEELSKYFATLLYCRVAISTGVKMSGGHKPATLRRIFVPARFAVILSMVGEVVYPDVSVRIIPATSVTEEDIYTMAELAEMSQKLERFFADGFCGTIGISMDRYGDPHFMNKVAIIDGKPQDCIKSMTKDNPLYGFMAWVMNAELLEVAYSEARYLLRVNYSEPHIYAAMANRTWTGWKVETDGTKNNETPADGSANVLNTNS